MSTREQLTLIHSLEEHGIVMICGSDEELAEAISYELDSEGDDDN